MGIFSKIKNIFKKEENLNLSEKAKIYEKGLEKSRNGFSNKILSLTNRYKEINDEYLDELEEILIMADVGIETVMDFMNRIRKRIKDEKIKSLEYLKEVIIDELFVIYVNDVIETDLKLDKKLNVILFIGVNGVGKTTTIAKIADLLDGEGKKTMMIAGDTFRAGAKEQLYEWSKKCRSLFYGGSEEEDPASVIYKGLEKAKEEEVDVVLIDTAGRLQNKSNLMKELEKINKVIKNKIESDFETLLVLDATNGQNAINQALSFKEITDITGIVLTKLDGTAKGGIILAIKEKANIPVKFVGLGERKEDLQVFDIEKYIYALFKDMIK